MCGFDEFDPDDLDDLDDPDDDFQEDLFEDIEPEVDGFEMDDEAEEPATPEPDAPESGLDFQEIFILGSMIAGQAYEEALDEAEEKKKKEEEPENGFGSEEDFD
ncbi:MAG: hypothetical protein A2521_08550 [Deltaproteobacteria bacterium RIFOXYD12_FULL_57_12]|nr:MAG: hypothetical protein A2521_08550 [Deltaproteobacteria bacterium RIFOXYD12_FULL_57_12]